ncbi:MAG: hypothetical protein ABJG41_12705 [Cyclobacteriaceae bacterium]
MQINDYIGRYKKPLANLVKYGLFVACCWFIYARLSGVGINFGAIDFREFKSTLAVVLLLMPVNWLLEAWRWQLSVPFENISLSHSLAVVLRGLTLNWVVPFTAGDLGSRTMQVAHRGRTLMSVGFNRLVILLVTVMYGGAAVFFFLHQGSWSYYIILAVAVLISLAVWIVWRKQLFGVSLDFLSSRLAFFISLITILRYAVFTFQFFLLFHFFVPELSAEVVFMGIGWVFLFRTVVPSVMGQIGIREASSIVFFEAYTDRIDLIVLACLIIWLINTIIPSILGLIPLIRVKPKLAR